MSDPKAHREDAVAETLEINEVKETHGDPDKILSRRHLFTGGFLGLIVQACSEAKFSEKGITVFPPKEAAALPPQEELATAALPDAVPAPLPAEPAAVVSDLPLEPEAPKKICKAIDNPKLDVAQATNASPETTPKVLFYGRRDSALIAIQLPASLDVKQLIVSTSAGKLIALHGISGADKDASAQWRPIIIDNIALLDRGTALTELVILMQTPAAKIKAAIPISFMTEFQNKPVVDLAGRTVPAEMLGNQSVAQFSEMSASFNSDDTVTYPNTYNTTVVRSLLTAKSTTVWTAGAAIRGIVTDIMGTPISITGANLLEYQVFCTYVATASGGWARTMLHVG